MYHIVYLTTNLINNKIYVGVHSTWNLNDSYLGSGKKLHLAITKYGIKNFKRQILYYCLTSNDAYEIEKQIININFIKLENTYNISIGGRNRSFKGFHHTKLSKNKISIGNKGKIVSIETRIKLSYPKTEAHKENAKIAALNRPQRSKKIKTCSEFRSKEHYEKIANSRRGKKNSKNACKNMQKPHVLKDREAYVQICKTRIRNIYYILNECNIIIEVKNLKIWCIENILNYQNILHTFKSKKFYNGYKIVDKISFRF
jgi:hypothetical protein